MITMNILTNYPEMVLLFIAIVLFLSALFCFYMDQENRSLSKQKDKLERARFFAEDEAMQLHRALNHQNYQSVDYFIHVLGRKADKLSDALKAARSDDSPTGPGLQDDVKKLSERRLGALTALYYTCKTFNREIPEEYRHEDFKVVLENPPSILRDQA